MSDAKKRPVSGADPVADSRATNLAYRPDDAQAPNAEHDRMRSGGAGRQKNEKGLTQPDSGPAERPQGD